MSEPSCWLSPREQAKICCWQNVMAEIALSTVSLTYTNDCTVMLTVLASSGWTAVPCDNSCIGSCVSEGLDVLGFLARMPGRMTACTFAPFEGFLPSSGSPSSTSSSSCSALPSVSQRYCSAAQVLSRRSPVHWPDACLCETRSTSGALPLVLLELLGRGPPASPLLHEPIVVLPIRRASFHLELLNKASNC